MFANLEILRTAQALAGHAGLRQQAIAQNVANADTPGFLARDALPFGDYLAAMAPPSAPAPARSDDLLGGVFPTRASGLPVAADDLIRPDPSPVTRAPDGNTVSLEHEMTRAAEVRAQHDMALGIYSTARDLLRASIGR